MKPVAQAKEILGYEYEDRMADIPDRDQVRIELIADAIRAAHAAGKKAGRAAAKSELAGRRKKAKA